MDIRLNSAKKGQEKKTIQVIACNVVYVGSCSIRNSNNHLHCLCIMSIVTSY